MKIFKKVPKKQQIRVILFSKTSSGEKFVGLTTAIESTDDKLGLYIKLKDKKVGISSISSEDFSFDSEYGKCLMIMKYAEDDFRVMKIMRTGNWFKKEKVSYFNEGGQEERVEEYKPYEECLGVDQDSRTAMRFKRQFDARQDELYKDKLTGLEKWAPIMSVAIVGIILLVGFIYMNNSHKQTIITISQDWTEEAKQYNNDNFFAGLTEWANRNAGETDVPNI